MALAPRVQGEGVPVPLEPRLLVGGAGQALGCAVSCPHPTLGISPASAFPYGWDSVYPQLLLLPQESSKKSQSNWPIPHFPRHLMSWLSGVPTNHGALWSCGSCCDGGLSPQLYTSLAGSSHQLLRSQCWACPQFTD